MQVEVLNSGSKGNGYIVRAGDDVLLLECGVKSRDVLKALQFNVRNISGCLVSHHHEDHLRYIREYFKYGFPVCMTAESKPDGCPVRTLPRMKRSMVGAFEVVPFKVPHAETECDGFYIRHPSMGNLLFITDAEMCPFNLRSLRINHVMVECNYSIDYLTHDGINRNHILTGHMELQTCKRFIRSIYSKDLKSIGLIHLSKLNGDPERFQKEMEEEFPDSYVWVAEKGKTITL